MTMGEYSSKVLHVDLTNGQIRTNNIDQTLIKFLIGGWGITHKLAYDLIPAGIDPYSPENAIILGTGPFNGTIVPGSSRACVTYKSPLTNGIITNNGGGSFSIMLKSNGYDFVTITGKSEKPVYILISDTDVKLVDASNLWGTTDTSDTCDALRNKHEPCSIIAIGPAGERLVRYSLTFNDKGGGSIGNGGLGAVFGAKKLKAIVVCQGTTGVKVAHPGRLQQIVDRLLTNMMNYRFRPVLLQGGTYSMGGSVWMRDVGKITDNYTRVWINPGYTGKEMENIHQKTRKTMACPSCPLGDKELNRLVEGDHAPMTAYMTDFLEHPSYHDSKDIIQDHNRAVYYFDLANRLGIDKYNFENVFTLLTFLYQKGVINKDDTGGFELNEDFDTKVKALKLVANREGIGNLMAEGALRAARQLGRGAEDYVCHIKGAVPWEPLDPRRSSLGTMEFCQIETPGRPFYVPGGVGVYMRGRPLEDYIKHMSRIGVPKEVVPRLFTKENYKTGRLTKWAEDWYSLFNCLGQCHRLYIHRFQSIDTFVDIYDAITGIKSDPRELLKVGERAWNLYKILNVREGFTRKDDRAPKIWFTPLKGTDGKEYPLKDYFETKESLTEEDIEEMLNDYYDERGWDIATSIPTREKILELGLDQFIKINDLAVGD